MKILIITTALLFGTTATAFAQTSNQVQSQQGLSAPQYTTGLNPTNARRSTIIRERETTGMGSREPEVEFLFDPGTREPQRNDLTVSPLGPMNNIE